MKKRWMSIVLPLIALCIILIGGVKDEAIQSTESENALDIQTEEEQTELVVEYVEKEEPVEENIQDNSKLYEETDDGNSVITMYLTVSSGNEADSSNHTWEEVNSYSSYYYSDLGVDRYKVEGILQIDEGNGVSQDSFGYNEVIPNVSVQVRGQSSTQNKVKNYKIRIKDGKGEFRGQRTLALNKHVGDVYRITNKTCYEMMEDVPQLIGGRTQFVNLYVNDTTDGSDDGFVDYGLYTMVEQVNKTYLKNRGLDEKGQLYKVTFFEWNKYEAVSIPYDSAEFDVEEFEQYLEIKGDKDNTKLNNVVNELANTMIPIEEIVDKYFDEENICYWMAFNILVGNYDSGARNLFLYSPLNSEKFYIFCWDMDASLKTYSNINRNYTDGQSWEHGMSMYLGVNLMNRMLKEEKYRDMLDDAIEDLYSNAVNPERVETLVSEYKEVVLPYLYGGADSDNARVDYQTYEELSKSLGDEIRENYEYYKASLNKPWPFYVGVPEEREDKMLLQWDVAYDINGEAVKYSYVLARDYYFTDVIVEESELVIPTTTIDKLEPGRYFLRVKATNESGYEQDSFDYTSIKGIGKIFDCLCFDITPEGEINVVSRIEKM